MATHISFLHASMVAHMQNPYSEFHSVTIRTHQVLFPLSIVAPWVNFKTQYHDFMTTRTQGGVGQILASGGLDYHYCRVVTQRGVRAEGDYFIDLTVHISFTHYTSPTCTYSGTMATTCTRCSIAAPEPNMIKVWR